MVCGESHVRIHPSFVQRSLAPVARANDATTTTGTSDCLHAIVPPVRLGRVAQGAGFLRIRKLVQTAFMCVRYRFAGYSSQRRERLGITNCEDWSFLETADRQTDRQDKPAISKIETQFYKLRTTTDTALLLLFARQQGGRCHGALQLLLLRLCCCM